MLVRVKPSTLVRFRDRRAAYRFVSEIRRRYDLDRLANVHVQPIHDDDVVVEVPSEGWSNEVADVAERHGGREPATQAELDKLRAAIGEAREMEHETRLRLARSREAVQQARKAVRRTYDQHENRPS